MKAYRVCTPWPGASVYMPRDLHHHVLSHVDWEKIWRLARVGVKTGRGWWSCLRMFGAQYLYHPLSNFCTVLLRLQHTPHLPLGNPPHHCPQLNLEHQAVVGLRPVILVLLPAGGGEVLPEITQRLLHEHPVTPGLPHVKPILDPLPYRMGCGNTLGSLQYHCLEENVPLQVPQSVLQPMKCFVQVHNKASHNLPSCCVITSGRHDHEITSPPLPYPAVHNFPVKAIFSVGVHPVPVGLLESDVLWGWGITWQISLLPLSVLCF